MNDKSKKEEEYAAAIAEATASKTAAEESGKKNGSVNGSGSGYALPSRRFCRKMLSGKLKRCRRTLSRLTAEYGKEAGNDARLAALYEWLYDNGGLLSDTVRSCLLEAGKLARVPYIGKEPRLVMLVRRFSECADFPMTDRSFTRILQSAERHFDLSLAEFLAARTLFSSALVCRCADILALALEDRDNSEGYTLMLSYAVTSVRCALYFRFDRCMLESRTARLLQKDPSGAFPKMTPESQAVILSEIQRLSEKRGVSEYALASSLLQRAEGETDERKRFVGYPLYGKGRMPKCLWFFAVLLLTAALTAALAFFVSPIAVLTLLPLYDGAKQVVSRLFSHFVRTLPLPRLELSEVPDDSPVLVVITSLLLGEASDEGLFSDLEKLYCTCGGRNVTFGILGDLADSKNPTHSGDEAVLEYAYGRINALNLKYGRHFVLLERRRSYSASERLFMGKERKRGAVCELVRLLRGKPTTFTERSASMFSEVVGSSCIRYVITLDADTHLPLDGVRLLCSVMLHPMCRPRIDREKGYVTDGFGILQPKCTAGLTESRKTPFTGFMTSGGAEQYAGASFDLYMSVFGDGIFCGKGIFDVDAFDALLIGSHPFPDDLVLSHDAVEGARLRCGALTDMEMTDSFPKNQLSYLKRRHRWVRGDVQNGAFLRRVFSFAGKKYESAVPLLSRFRLLDSILGAAVPFFSFAAVMTAGFLPPVTGSILTLAAIGFLLLPTVFDGIAMVFSASPATLSRRYFSRDAYAGMWRSLFGTLFFIAMLPKTAFSTLDAFTRSLYRRFVSHKNLLEWQTAAQSDAGDGSLLMFVNKNMLCIMSGFLLLVFAPAGLVRATALLWFIFPVPAYLTSLGEKREKEAEKTEEKTEEKTAEKSVDEPKKMRRFPFAKEREEAEKQCLSELAREIWSFFEENVTGCDNFLPPDNISIAPMEKTAHRTSPTNIGLYLVSILCARDFDFISTDRMCEMISRTLDTAERLEKKNGHLFNWYDTENLAVLSPAYISAVDSGNLSACLYTLRAGLGEYAGENTAVLSLMNRVEALCEGMDYSFLYSGKRELFSLGAFIDADGKAEVSEGCYDIYMSEARILSYIETAKRHVPKKHWDTLARPLTGRSGYIGLYSWTGTAFEYFLPAVFLPTVRGSLDWEALHFALREQRRRAAYAGKTALWGISESGFFAFDGDMNYRYRAFGVPSLSLKNGQEKHLVLSPYSSYLAMCVGKHTALSNILNMKKLGYGGRYGLYEAIDFTGRETPDGAVVKSYMSHHMGMSLAALTNAAFDGILRRRFMQDPYLAGASSLLCGKIPQDAPIGRKPSGKSIPERPKRQRAMGEKTVISLGGGVFLYSAQEASVTLSSYGHVEMRTAGRCLNVCSRERYDLFDTFSVFLDGKDGVLSASAVSSPSERGEERYRKKHRLHLTEGYGEYTGKNAENSVCAAFTVSTEKLLPVFRVRVLVGGKPKDGAHRVAFTFTPCLTEMREYASHPGFSGLFVEAEYLESEGILLYHRRKRGKNGEDVYLGVRLTEGTVEGFDTRADDVFTTPFSKEQYRELFDAPCRNRTGTLVTPYCRILARAVKRDGENAENSENGINGECGLSLCMGTDRSKVLASLHDGRTPESFEDAARFLASSTSEMASLAGSLLFASGRTACPAELLLSALFFGKAGVLFPQEETEDEYAKVPLLRSGQLWKVGISGNLPIVVLKAVTPALYDRLEKYIRSAVLLRRLGERFDLVILLSETDLYGTPERRSVEELVLRAGARELSGKKDGGIFIVDAERERESVSALLAKCCLFIDLLREDWSVIRRFYRRLPILLQPCLSEPFSENRKPLCRTAGGSFTEDSFSVSKTGEFTSPMSFMLCGRRLCSLVTHNSLGCTWYRNADLGRITPRTDGRLLDMQGERLFLIFPDRMIDLCAKSCRVTMRPGVAEYEGNADGIGFYVKVCVSEKLCVKFIDISLNVPDGAPGEAFAGTCALCYAVLPAPGGKDAAGIFRKDGAVFFRSGFCPTLEKVVCFVKGLYGDGLSETALPVTSEEEILTGRVLSRLFPIEEEAEGGGRSSEKKRQKLTKNASDGRRDIAAAVIPIKKDDAGKKRLFRFALGTFPADSEKTKEYTFSALHDGEREYNAARAFALSLLPKYRLSASSVSAKAESGGDASVLPFFIPLFNTFIPYQNAAFRFLGRSGYNQTGGAYGFRDSLQDVLCLMHARPDMAKQHVLRAAHRQFPEGDVLHWWHESVRGKGGIVCPASGTRTLCSDDYLWLPFVVSQYCGYTGDYAILDIPVRYIEEEKPEAGGKPCREKYIEVRPSGIRESLYDHCTRALRLAKKRIGKHGLPLIGSCDWCDGYSEVGDSEGGESVWVAMFLCLTAGEFEKLCRRRGDTEFAAELSGFARALCESTEKHGYSEKHGQYIRGFYKSGKELGGGDNLEGSIDLLPQSFAFFLPVSDRSRFVTAMENAVKKLWYSETSVFRLVCPPFTGSTEDPGYIASYCAGVRENGGQYTHAAVWGAAALVLGAAYLLQNGERARGEAMRKSAEKALLSLNPACRTSGFLGKSAMESYGKEPYLIPADLYFGKGISGMGGWTGYTGSAGWYENVLLRYVFGIRINGLFGKNPTLTFDSSLPALFPDMLRGAVLRLSFDVGKGSEYGVRYDFSASSGVTLDGEACGDNVPLEEGRHTVVITRKLLFDV